MCGIAGTAGIRLTPELLNGVTSSLSHRGPDSIGSWSEGEISLVHTRLKVVDLSDAAAQPMIDSKTGVIIIYNGEIYNCNELRRNLNYVPFKSHSDTEVILNLYLECGIDAVSKLRGMFAFAIWDPRYEVMHLVRDRFGIKPLYVARRGDALVFSSEIKGILAFGIPARLNRRVITDYLVTGRLNHSEETFFDGVKSLPAATRLTFYRGTIKTKRYWHIEDLGKDTVFADNDDEEIEEGAWELLKSVVDDHLVADVPIGVSLSSGLDSQLIMRTLSALKRDEIHTFTYGFPNQNYDEISRVKTTNFGMAIHNHSLVTNPTDLLPSLEDALHYFESPLGGLGTLSSYRLMRLANEHQIPVLLFGEGADEVFGGYRYYYDAYFKQLQQSSQTDLLKHELESYLSLDKSMSPAVVGELCSNTGINDAQQLAPDGTKMSGCTFLGSSLEELVGRVERSDSFIGQDRPSLRSRMLQDVEKLKLPKLLHFQDRASMAWGIESRVPFLDHRFVEAIYGLSDRWIIRDGVSKYLAKRIIQKFCGVNKLQETKHYVATPQREWVKFSLHNSIVKYLKDGLAVQHDLIDLEQFLSEYDQYVSQPSLGNSFFVWKVLNLEAFMRRFFQA